MHRFALPALLFLSLPLAVADDWTTSDGKTYHQVHVVKIDDDAVTILDSDGGALVPLAALPSNLQQQFHYDPAKAKAAADRRQADDAANAQAIAAQQKAAAAAAATPPPTPPPAPAPAPVLLAQASPPPTPAAPSSAPSSMPPPATSQFSLNKGDAGNAAAGHEHPNPNWKLVWSDEFDGNDIDKSKWNFEIDGKGGGNGEEEYYTDKPENAHIDNGHLIITAIKDGTDADDRKHKFTSARMTTKGKGFWKYGRFEGPASSSPPGKGVWPAFWMMPEDSVYGGWASSGELDIMEEVGDKPATAFGTIHYGDKWPRNTHTGDKYTLPSGILADDWHTYSVEWENGVIRWYFDDNLYETQTKWYTKAAPFPAPFDQNFYIVLNFAVGGAWPGKPSADTPFPQTHGRRLRPRLPTPAMTAMPPSVREESGSDTAATRAQRPRQRAGHARGLSRRRHPAPISSSSPSSPPSSSSARCSRRPTTPRFTASRSRRRRPSSRPRPPAANPPTRWSPPSTTRRPPPRPPSSPRRSRSASPSTPPSPRCPTCPPPSPSRPAPPSPATTPQASPTAQAASSAQPTARPARNSRAISTTSSKPATARRPTWTPAATTTRSRSSSPATGTNPCSALIIRRTRRSTPRPFSSPSSTPTTARAISACRTRSSPACTASGTKSPPRRPRTAPTTSSAPATTSCSCASTTTPSSTAATARSTTKSATSKRVSTRPISTPPSAPTATSGSAPPSTFPRTRPSTSKSLIGEEPGGKSDYFLYIQRDESTYEKQSNGSPLLPVFQLDANPIQPAGAPRSYPPFAAPIPWEASAAQ